MLLTGFHACSVVDCSSDLNDLLLNQTLSVLTDAQWPDVLQSISKRYKQLSTYCV